MGIDIFPTPQDFDWPAAIAQWSSVRQITQNIIIHRFEDYITNKLSIEAAHEPNYCAREVWAQRIDLRLEHWLRKDPSISMKERYLIEKILRRQMPACRDCDCSGSDFRYE